MFELTKISSVGAGRVHQFQNLKDAIYHAIEWIGRGNEVKLEVDGSLMRLTPLDNTQSAVEIREVLG